jgi:tetratricopeptide (TPR) repeat protein/tRNA A-37 threonylcarbamoyl transferase component Bud32
MRATRSALTGRFELEQLVGEGAFGEVYRARDRATGGVVAVKRLHRHLENPVTLERFEREARLLARVDSPYVVGYVAHGPDDEGRPCIAIEWLDGEDLARRQRTRPLGPAEGVEVVRQAALGLSALHRAGVVHRDVKPANFFLLSQPGASGADRIRVKLVDLGVARVRAEDGLTAVGARVGTPLYMSPEQARGDEGVDARSDVFSLGVVLYELLSGRLPFTGDQSVIVLAKIVLNDPPPLSSVAPYVPRDLEAIVAAAMAKDPEARIASADDLAALLADVRVPAAPGGPRAAPSPSQMPPAASTHGLSATREQRVVAAVFAGFGDAPDAGDSMHAFARIAAAQGGATYQTLGNRLIALFGAARSTGDEAVRAARVALQAGMTTPGVALSIATGRAVADEAGISADAIERGAVLVPPWGGVRLDAPTARLLAPHFAVEERDGAHVLLGERAPGPVAAPRLLGRETPIVGRDREIALILATFEECEQEPVARAALVTAPAGTGKSRLAFEIQRRLAARPSPPTVLTARGDSLSAGSPFRMAADLVRDAARIDGAEPPAAARRKLEARVRRHVAPGAAEGVIAFLGELADLPPDGSADPVLDAVRRDPIVLGDAKRAAFEDFLEAECAAGPVVIVLEDLHWGDAPSVKLVDAALRRLAAQPLFVLALARPEVHDAFPGLWAERGVQEHRLGGLTRRAAEKLLYGVLGPDAPAATVERIAARADGNAFFLEELARAEVEGNALVPDTVLGMVQARLDALGSASKRVLRTASVFGQAFPLAGVAAVAPEHGTASVSSLLDDLVAREVLVQRAAAPNDAGRWLSFRHALVHEAAYAMLTEADRVLGHRLAGEWLAAAGGADPAVLAEHFVRGGEPLRAAPHYLRAGEGALAGNDLPRALDLARRGVETDVGGPTRGALHLLLAEALRWSGRTAEAVEAAEEALCWLPRAGVAWFRAMGELLTASGRRGDLDRVGDLLLAVASEAAAPGAAGAQVIAMCPPTSMLVQAGRYEVAGRVAARIADLAARNAPLEDAALARIAQLRATQSLRDGDLPALLRGYEEALAAYERSGAIRNACLERVNVAYARAQLGDHERAEAELRQSLAVALRMGLTTGQVFTQANLGCVLYAQGRLAEARATELAALAAARDAGPRAAGAIRVHLARIALLEGDAPAAAREAEVAAALLTVVPPLRAGALAALAAARLAEGRIDDALPPAREALALAQEGQRELFDAFVRLTFAEVAAAAGDDAAARAALHAARARILAIADRIEDPTLRERFLVRVEDNRRTLELAALLDAPRG